MAKPGIDQLLIQSALDADLCRRLLESPDVVFGEYELTNDEKEILRHPDHRLLGLLGATLTRQFGSSGHGPESLVASSPASEDDVHAATAPALRALPDTLLAVTVVPCALREAGELKGITYVLWANPLPEGTDPSALPVPAGTVFPGDPLAPLRAIMRISALQGSDANGNPQFAIWGAFQPAHAAGLPPPPESSGDVEGSPYQSPLHSEDVQKAVAAVRAAPGEEKYDRLVDLLHALHAGGTR